jgi:uncharacterized protein YndB with AHSA1/START domain
MATNTSRIQATPEQVWEVLADGWLYPLWVVGATRMRDVDKGWPAVGTRLHHSVGTWPLVLNDDTEVVECVPNSLLKLHAHGWPAGMAEVVIRLEPVGGETQLSLEEDVIAGPGGLMPKPLRDLQIGWRNRESLLRLSFLAERRVAGRSATD